MIVHPPFVKSRSLPSTYTANDKVHSAPAYRKKFNKYIIIPAFAYTGITWYGASHIVGTFNFTQDKLNSFPLIPDYPTGANFILCVSWKVGTTVYRYKFWQDKGELLYVPLYTNQSIPTTSFKIEVWNVSGETDATMADELMFETSELVSPSLTCCDNEATDDSGAYSVCTDNLMPLTGIVWSGVDGDSWTFTSCGVGTFVDIVSPPTAEPPQNVSATKGTSETQIVVTWDPDTTGHTVLYDIYRNTTDDYSTSALVGADQPEGAYTDNDVGLMKGQAYYYWVVKNDDTLGVDSAESTPGALGFLKIVMAGGITASDGTAPDYITIVWGTGSGITGFELRRSLTSNFADAIRVYTGGASVYQDYSVLANVPYYYWVRGTNILMQTPWVGPDSGYTSLAAPSGLTFTYNPSGGATLNWLDNSTGEDGFHIHVSYDAGSTWESLATVGPGVTSLLFDIRFTDMTGWRYRVRSYKGSSASLWYNLILAPPTLAPETLHDATNYDSPGTSYIEWTDRGAPTGTLILRKLITDTVWYRISTIVFGTEIASVYPRFICPPYTSPYNYLAVAHYNNHGIGPFSNYLQSTL
jgi:hypothetical protein